MAAGSSSRLGTPKQLLPYKEQNLLQHSLKQAIQSNARLVVVVLGANADQIADTIKGTHAVISVNNQWQQGMASSICTGLNALTEQIPDLDAAIFMVCDQPYVTSIFINKMIERRQQSRKQIIASRYENSAGIPALFGAELFTEILALRGETGAKKIIQKDTGRVGYLDFEKGGIDIDTPEDYQQLDKTE